LGAANRRPANAAAAAAAVAAEAVAAEAVRKSRRVSILLIVRQRVECAAVSAALACVPRSGEQTLDPVSHDIR